MPDEENPNEVYLFLTLAGKAVDPDQVTDLLGMLPSTKHKLGDRHGKNKEMVWKTGLWLLDSQQYVESKDIEQHMIWLLDQLEPAKVQFTSLMSKIDVSVNLTIIAALFTRNWQFDFDTKTLGRLAALKIPLSFTITYMSYSYEEEE